MILVFISGLIILIIACFIISPYIKGKVGEFKVDKKLNKLLSENEYKISNIIINDIESDRTSQIDEILFTKKGIFVIEVKNYSGEIYGNSYSKDFTQAFPNGKKYKFYSPIKQNQSHIYYLNKYNEKNLKIYSAIIFLNNNIKNVKASNVFTIKKFITYYNSLENLYTDEYIDFYNIVKNVKFNNISMKEHLANIKQTKRNLEEGKCPRCGANLVRRNGKYGEFIGCSNYPSCKFTSKIQ